MIARWSVDSIEDGVAALLAEGRVMHLPADLLPEGTREGDVLLVERRTADGGVSLHVRVDPGPGDRAAEESGRMLEVLREKDRGGDLTL